MMMLAAEVWVKENGFDCIYVNSLHNVVGFYEKCGYNAEYRPFIYEPTVLMKKEI